MASNGPFFGVARARPAGRERLGDAGALDGVGPVARPAASSSTRAALGVVDAAGEDADADAAGRSTDADAPGSLAVPEAGLLRPV